jgi:hypothetical protein
MSTISPPKSAEQPLAELVGYSMMCFDVKHVDQEFLTWLLMTRREGSIFLAALTSCVGMVFRWLQYHFNLGIIFVSLGIE